MIDPNKVRKQIVVIHRRRAKWYLSRRKNGPSAPKKKTTRVLHQLDVAEIAWASPNGRGYL